jgi:LysR family transcriptional regulator, hypochlorite-specific transcription factor HypT
MDTKWLEDFVSVAGTRSFSRSAQLRHVTQPAFSAASRRSKDGPVSIWWIA